MARGAKKEIALTPEEKLAQALVPEAEQPYRVPENWRWVRLTRGFAECKDSFRKPINATERSNRIGSIPYYGATGQVGWIDDYLTDEELVLLGEDGAPFLDLLKDKAYLISGKAWVNNHAHILKSFFGHIGNLFLVNYLNSFNFSGYVNGTTRLKLTQSSMDMIPVPCPPLPEQRRIVDRIESLFAKLDEAKEKAQVVVDGFEDRKAAILHKAFTGELTAEWRKTHDVSFKTWKRASIDSLCEVFSGKGFKEKEYSISGIKLLRISNVTYDSLIWDDTKYLPESYLADVPELVLKPEDIVMALNRPITNGKLKVSIVGNEDVYILYQRVGCLRIRNQSNLLTEYFRYALLSKDFLHQVECNLQGSDQPYINLPPLKKLTLNICSIQEQHEIVRIISDIDASEKQAKTAAEQVIDQINTMKKAILARAFRGELGTNDPTEESAEGLLKDNMNRGGVDGS